MADETKPTDRMYWHGIFYEATELELIEYRDDIHIENEHLLSKQALQIDVLVIKKNHDIVIQKNIGKIFKSHNILEYKSLADNLNPDDYNKVIAYGLLYASFNSIDIKDVTITFVIPKISPSLWDYLTLHREFKVLDAEQGIYHVVGETFTTQIIEQKQLSSTNNLFLSNIKKDISKHDIEKMLLSLEAQGSLNHKSRVIQMLLQTSFKHFKEVMDMSVDLTLDEALEKLKDTGTWYRKSVNKDIEQTKVDIAKKMTAESEPIEKIVFYTGLSPEIIKNL